MVKRIMMSLTFIVGVVLITFILGAMCINVYLDNNYGFKIDENLLEDDYFTKNKEILMNKGIIEDVNTKEKESLEVEEDSYKKSNIPIKDIYYKRNVIDTYNTDYQVSFGVLNVIKSTVNSYKGASSFYLLDLVNGGSIAYNVDTIYQAASSIKAAYCLYLYEAASEEKIDLEEEIPYLARYYNDGTGVVKNSEFGTMYKVRDLIRDTIIYSDNTAYKMLHGRFGVLDYNAMLDNLGVKRLHLTYANPWGLPDLRSLAIIWQEIYNFSLEDEEYGREYLNLLSENIYNYLKETRPKTFSATKEGFTDDVTIESGILFESHPILVVVGANKAYDKEPVRQVKYLLSRLNLIIDEYLKEEVS